MDAVLSFRFRRFERRIENTEAASVELNTAPISMLSQKSNLSTTQQKIPVAAAVKSTPSVESSTAFPATGLACFQFVPKPP